MTKFGMVTHGEGRVLGGQPRHCVCTNASSGLSAKAEFLMFSCLADSNSNSLILHKHYVCYLLTLLTERFCGGDSLRRGASVCTFYLLLLYVAETAKIFMSISYCKCSNSGVDSVDCLYFFTF